MSKHHKNRQSVDVVNGLFSHEILILEEVKSLMPLIREGNKNARNKLVEHNLRLVVSILKKFKCRGLSSEDLIQEGFLGLIRATESFDESAGFTFPTYAIWWIIQKMASAIQNNSTVRIPANVMRNWRRLKRVEEELSKYLNRKPLPVEIAEKGEVEIEIINGLTEKMEAMNIYKETGEEDDLMINLMRDRNLSADQMVMAADELRSGAADLKFKLSEIKVKEKDLEIFKARYDLNGFFEIKTINKTRKIFNLSRERVRIICRGITLTLKKKYGDESVMEAEKWFENKIKTFFIFQNLSEQIINLNDVY